MLLDHHRFHEAYGSIRAAAAAAGGCSVLIFVSPSCDSMAACRLLSILLSSDDVSYKIRPIAGYADLMDANELLVKGSTVKSVVMINCGGPVELLKLLELDDDQVCYVIDCHKPAHHTNVHSDAKIVIIDDGELQLEDVPEIGDERFADMEDASEYEDDDGDDADGSEHSDDDIDSDARAGSDADGSLDSDGVRKRRRRGSRSDSVADAAGGTGGPPPRRHKKRRPIETSLVSPQSRARKHRLEAYYEGAFYGVPAAFLMYELAIQMNKSRNDLLWLAIIGVTDHFVEEHLDSGSYQKLLALLRDEVLSLNTESPGDIGGSAAPAGKDGHISFVEEYRFMLHRHWTLYDAMFHSSFMATRLGTWVSDTGRDKLEEFLAKIGIPLKDSRERFEHLSAATRDRLKQKLVAVANTYNLQDVLFGSFQLQIDFRAPVSASDVVHAVTALLTASSPRSTDAASPAVSGGADGSTPSLAVLSTGLSSPPVSDWRLNFQSAYNALISRSPDLLVEGIQHAIALQQAVVRLAPDLYGRKGLWSTGLMRVLRIDDLIESDRALFTQPLALYRLGRYLIDMQKGQKKQWEGHRSKPLVVCTLDSARRLYTVVGLPCPEDKFQREKTKFTYAFNTSAVETQSQVKMDSFDSSVLQIEQDDIHRFVEYLQRRLAEA